MEQSNKRLKNSDIFINHEPEMPEHPYLSKWITILVITIVSLIVIGMVAWGAYQYLNQTPAEEFVQVKEIKDPTADWQTYRNEEYGFEVKYPPTWILRQGYEAVIFSNVSEPSTISETALQTESFFEIGVFSQANPNLLPISQWFDQFFSGGFATEPLSVTPLVVDDHDAIRVETSEIGTIVHIYVFKEFDVIEIIYGLYALQFVDEYKQILSTFKFIETNPTADWQTYRNEEYNIEFRYPEGWIIEVLGGSDMAGIIEQIEVGRSFDEYDFSKDGISFYVLPLPELPDSIENSWPWKSLEKTPISINGFSGIHYEGFYEDENSESGFTFISDIFIYKNDYLYNLSFTNEGQYPSSQYTIFEQIITTITFAY